MQQHFRILGAGLTLSGPGEILEPIAFAYRRFAVPVPEAGGVRFELDESDLSTLCIGSRQHRLVPDLDPALQTYQLLLNWLMDRIGSHAVLHAASVRDRSGQAILLAAPSGHGKTSLTLELAHRGLGFMSDDYAPLDLERREVLPYPRAVGIIGNGGAPIPDSFRQLAAEPETTRLFGKSLVDVGQALGEDRVATAPARLRHVVFLSADLETARPAVTWLLVAARSEHADGLHDTFAGTRGVEILERDDRPHLTVWRLRLSHDLNPTGELAETLDGGRILFSEKHWEAQPEFEGEPRADPISRREAAERLGRELLNRRRGGMLLARYGNSLPALFTDLAGALKNASCWRVRVGDYRATADLLERLSGG